MLNFTYMTAGDGESRKLAPNDDGGIAAIWSFGLARVVRAPRRGRPSRQKSPS